jgi:hypothetical protein
LLEIWREAVVRAYVLTTSTILVVVGLLPAQLLQHKVQILIVCFAGLSITFLVYHMIAPRRYADEEVDPADLSELDEIRVVHDSEAIAARSNRIARAHFGKTMGFPYAMYKRWRQKNRRIFAAFVSREGCLLGFVDVFPLTDSAGASILNGDLAERDLDLDDLLDERSVDSCNYVHVASVICAQRSQLARYAVEQAALSYIYHTFAPQPKRIYTAIPTTSDGERVLKRLGLRKWLSGTITDAGKDVYEIASDEICGSSHLAKSLASIRVRLVEDVGGGELRISLPPRTRRRLRRPALTPVIARP